MVLATNTKIQQCKNTKYKNVKEEEIENGLSQNTTKTTLQKYKNTKEGEEM